LSWRKLTAPSLKERNTLASVDRIIIGI
jgi:hypothetical protein